MKCTRLICCFCLKVGRINKTYKYALTLVDLETRYKEAEPLTSKDSKEVAMAFEKIYKRHLKYPKLLQVDPGREFMGAVTQLMAKHNVRIRRSQPEIHRHQGVVKSFNRTLAERPLSVCKRARKSPQTQQRMG